MNIDIDKCFNGNVMSMPASACWHLYVLSWQSRESCSFDWRRI